MNKFHVGQRVKQTQYGDEGVIISCIRGKGYLVDYGWTTCLDDETSLTEASTPDEIFKDLLR